MLSLLGLVEEFKPNRIHVNAVISTPTHTHKDAHPEQREITQRKQSKNNVVTASALHCTLAYALCFQLDASLNFSETLATSINLITQEQYSVT